MLPDFTPQSPLATVEQPPLSRASSRPLVWLEPLALALMGALMLYQLVGPPFIGLADNGDSLRTIHHVGLDHLPGSRDDLYFAYIRPYSTAHPTAASNPPSPPNYLTSETLLVGVAVAANRLVSADGLFDLHVMGVAHTLWRLLGLMAVSTWPATWSSTC